jgi:hypothetical protein
VVLGEIGVRFLCTVESEFIYGCGGIGVGEWDTGFFAEGTGYVGVVAGNEG